VSEAGTVEQKRKIIPPVYLLMALATMGLLHRFLPLAQIIQKPFTYVGVLPLVAGLLIAITAVRAFHKAGTPVVPFEPSTALVTTGMYRHTRNPMYLALVLILLGVWILLGTLGPLVPVVAFVWIIQSNFIRGEERFLEGIFGDEYRAYKQRVRRWL
jgi:protein-S-isoprenylcysteine O-methyltransferase Ste14